MKQLKCEDIQTFNDSMSQVQNHKSTITTLSAMKSISMDIALNSEQKVQSYIN